MRMLAKRKLTSSNINQKRNIMKLNKRFTFKGGLNMKFARFTVAVAMLALMLLSSVTVYADTPPIVDGAMYGPGDGTTPDIGTYTYLKDVMGGNAWVYDYHHIPTQRYYVAVVLNPNYADNVFDAKVNRDQDYLNEVGWVDVGNRSFKALYQSDKLGEGGWITFECPDPNPLNEDLTYQWDQTLIDGLASCQDNPYTTACRDSWVSQPEKDGATLPPNPTASSSIVWNMKNHINWNVTVTEGANPDDWKEWKSPDDDADSNDGTSAKDWGWGTTWYDDYHKWEWLTVYEMAFDVGQCGAGDWTFNRLYSNLAGLAS